MAGFLSWTLIFVIQAALSVLGTSLVALRCGQSPRPYFPLSIFLGLGSIPLTYLMIVNSEPLGPKTETSGFSPFRSPEPEPIDSTVGADTNQTNAAAELASWAKFANSLHRALMSSIIGLTVGSAALAVGVFEFIMPHYVFLFDGIALKLPLPFDSLIRISKFFEHSHAGLWFWILSLSLPSCLYLFLYRGGYMVPILGRIWRHSDRLWQLYLLQAGFLTWLDLVPAHVARRLHHADVPPLQQHLEQLSSLIRQERDLLNASLWMCLPVLSAVVGLLALATFILALILSLPFYQIHGNL